MTNIIATLSLRHLRICCFAVLMCACLSALFAQIKASDHIFIAGEHVPANIRAAATGGAGVAVADGIAGILHNPATLHSFNAYNAINISALVCYGTGEDIFSRHNLSAGAGARLSDILSFGVMYRYMKPENEENRNNQVSLNISGRLFDRSLNKGVVNFGINANYERLTWQTGNFDSLYDTRIDIDPVSGARTTAILDTNVYTNNGELQRRRLTFDLGLYQNDIGQGLDFGVTFHDLAGYSWTRESPAIQRTLDSTQLITTTPGDTDTVACYYSEEYSAEQSQYNRWMNKNNRRVSIGMAFHKEVLQDKALIYFPFDFEIFNLFDLDTDTHVAFRTGLEVWIQEKYCLRFGYARAPEKFNENLNELENANIFSGGAGVRIRTFGADLYIRRSAWGLGGSLYL